MVIRPGQPHETIAAHYVEQVRDQLLVQVLDTARIGKLDPQWRQHLTAPSARAGYPVSDGDRAAVMEVQQLPPQPWEPGQSTDWRQALDSWFIAQSNLAVRSRVRAARNELMLIELQMVQVRNALLTHPGQDCGVVDAVQALPYTMLETQTAAVHLSQRDKLVGSYLAGLDDGGVSNDWVGWLRGRIQEWGDPLLMNSMTIQLAGPTLKMMWMLPHYWK